MNEAAETTESASEQLTQIQCSTAAPWLMSVVSAPLDTRLLLCSLIQPHAIKQKSHCMQGQIGEGGGAQFRVSSILPSRLSSPLRLSKVHALLSRHIGTQHTHHTGSQGLRCSEVNRIIWSCSILTLPWLKFHNRRVFISHNRFFCCCCFCSPFSPIHPSIHLPITLPVIVAPAVNLAVYTCSSPRWPPWNPKPTIEAGRTDREVKGRSAKKL